MIDAVTILVIVPILIFALRWYLQRLHFEKLMNAIPGPKTYPFIGTLYIFFGIERKNFFQREIKLHQQYPEIMRTWYGPIGTVELKKAEYVEAFLKPPKQNLQKAFGYTFVQPWLGDSLLITAGDKWREHRKIITPTFHFSILENFCEIFSEKAEILIEKFSENCGSGIPVNIYPLITRATLDVICEAAMGVQLNTLGGTDSEYVRAVYEAGELIMRRFFKPWLYPKIIYQLSSDGKKFARTLNTLHSFTANVIQQKKQSRQMDTLSTTKNDAKSAHSSGVKKRLVFLDYLLETHEQGHQLLTDTDIRDEVDTFMFAGHDTTTAGIVWALFLLGQHPEIQENAHHEQQKIFQESKWNRPATMHDLNEMNYLERVIKEALRLYPSVPFIGRTVTEDVQIDQYTIPTGCMAAIDIYNLHRDVRYFPDPEKFDPDRFLPENTVNRHPYAYVPFSAGVRNCIGQKFAMFEEKSMLSSIIRNFRFRTVGDQATVCIVKELILRPYDGVSLIFEKRNV